jgi:hypothetical protein
VTPLKNPGNDAKLIAETLRGLGFEVIEKTDLTLKGFRSTVDEVAKKAGQYESVLLYYAGHGFQIDGGNYLVPVDSKLRDRKKFASETIDLNGIIGKLEGENHNTLILLDACRDNPAKLEGAQSSIAAGLAQMETGNGTFVAFATQPGNVTRDGAGDNSPFSIALAEHMQTEGISISDMMIRVRNTVEERTAGQQTPWDQSSLRSQFYFNPVVETTDSLTEEDLALLEQLDPALREKFMKRFGLNLNEDGTGEGEEVVATVTPSLRIEADNAEAEEVAAAETVQEVAAGDETNTGTNGVEPAVTNDESARTAVDQPPAAPRKPSLMVVALPDEEPDGVAEGSVAIAPEVAAKAEQAPQTLALATPQDINPVVPKPEPAPDRPEPEKAGVQDAAPPVSAQDGLQGFTPAAEPSNPAQTSATTTVEPAPTAKNSGASDARPSMLEPLAALTGQLAGKFQGLAKQAAQAPESKTVEQNAKPAIKPAEIKPLPATPKPEPAPVLTAKAEEPADVKPAAETIIALNKPAVSEPQKAKPLPVVPKTETAPVTVAKSVVPEAAKAEPKTTVALNNPEKTGSSFTLVPTQPEEKPSPAIALTPNSPKPADTGTAGAAKEPVIASKAADSPAPLATAATKAEEPGKPAAVAVAVATEKLQPALSGDQAKQPQASGGLLTSTAQTPAATPAVPAPVALEKQAPAEEQLLAMADPAPATKLAPAATEAAATPAPSTEPEAGKFAIPLPGDETDEEKKQLAIKAQKELTRLGCFRNETDGDWGPRSARALLRFYAEQKLDPDQLEPTAELVSRLSSIDKVVCKNTETDRPKRSVRKAPAKATGKTQPAAPAKPKAPAVQKAQPKPKPAFKAPPAVAKAAPASPPAGPKKKISGGALIGAFR